MTIIALEEHFLTEAVIDAWREVPAKHRDLAVGMSLHPDLRRRLLDMGDGRLREMDAAGVDVQVLSLSTPAVQTLERDRSVALAREANDTLAAAVRARPDRFQGWATLPLRDPEAAAGELERAVGDLGLCGAMLHGGTAGRRLDHPDHHPIFDAAARLRVPLYLHPSSPPSPVRAAYYEGFGEPVDTLFATAGIGWHYQAGNDLLRLVLAGTFDRWPDLQVVTGHWGESVLFYLERVDTLSEVAAEELGLACSIPSYFRRNVSVTPSGLFSQRYLRWAVEVLGAERILFSADHPFLPTAPDEAKRFLDEAVLDTHARTAIASGNWERLCAAIRR